MEDQSQCESKRDRQRQQRPNYPMDQAVRSRHGLRDDFIQRPRT